MFFLHISIPTPLGTLEKTSIGKCNQTPQFEAEAPSFNSRGLLNTPHNNAYYSGSNGFTCVSVLALPLPPEYPAGGGAG